MGRKEVLCLVLGMFVLISCKKEEKVTSISGKITVESGISLSVNNAKVILYDDWTPELGFFNKVDSTAATGGDVEANYQFEDISAGDYYLYAEIFDVKTQTLFFGFYDPEGDGAPNAVRVEEGETKENIDIVIRYTEGHQGSGKIEGTASLAEGVAGDLAGARVAIYTSQNDWQQDNVYMQTTATGQGENVTFSIESVPEGTYYLDVWKDVDQSGTWNAGDLAGVYGDFDPVQGTANLSPINIEKGQTVRVEVTVYRLGGALK